MDADRTRSAVHCRRADKYAVATGGGVGSPARSIDPAIPQIRRGLHFLGAALPAAALVASSPCPICWAPRRGGKADRKAVSTPCCSLRSTRQQGPLTHWSRRCGIWPLECQVLRVLGHGCLDAEVCEGSQTVKVHVLTMHYGAWIAVINQPRPSSSYHEIRPSPDGTLLSKL
jgi:hypothetical protein